MPAAMLTEVAIDDRGTSATAIVSIGGTVIPVEDTTQFDGDGGQLDICGIQYAYTSVDEVASTITLATVLTVAVAEFDPVLVVAGGKVAQTFLAVLDLGVGDNVSMEIPYEWRAQLPEGLCTPPIPVVVSADLTRILEIPDRPPTVSGVYVDTTGMPDPIPTTPPLSSPALTIKPNQLGFVIAAANIAPTSQIRYYVSSVSGFTPGPATLYPGTPTRSQVLEMRTLADGSPFLPATDYFFVAIATNVAGDAPATTQVSAQLKLVDSDQVDSISVSDLTSGSLTAAIALLGSLQVGQITLDPNLGLNIPLANGGLISLPADGSAAQFLRVLLQATALLVEDNFELRGTLSKLTGTLSMGSGVVASNVGPTVTSDPGPYITTPRATLGLVDGGAAGWVGAAGTKVYGFNKTTGAETVLFDVSPTYATAYTPARHIATGDWYLLVFDSGAAAWKIRKYNSSWVYSGTEFTVTIPAGDRIEGGIAIDGSTIYVGMRTALPNNYMLVRSMTLAGASQTTVFTTSVAESSESLFVGTADFGAQRFVISNGIADVRVYNTSGVLQTSQQWSQNGVPGKGLAWDGTNFYQLASNLRITKLSSVVTSTARSVRFSKYDSVGTTHETAWSPATGFTNSPRQWMRVSTPAPEGTGGVDEPNSIRHYIQSAGAGSYYRQADVTALPWVVLYGTPSIAGATVVSTPDFSLVASPGVLQSADAVLVSLKGNGSGRTGPMSWDATGVRTSDTGFITTSITVPASTVDGGTKYRVVDDLFVEVVGRITVSNNVSLTTNGSITNRLMCTLPVAARPTTNSRIFSGTFGARSAEYYINTSGEVWMTNVDGNGTASTATGPTDTTFSVSFIK